MRSMKLNVAVQVLQEVSNTFSKTKDFTNEKLEQKWAREVISEEEVIYYFFIVTFAFAFAFALIMKLCF